MQSYISPRARLLARLLLLALIALTLPAQLGAARAVRAATTASSGVTRFVDSRNGSDSNSGTQSKPFKTLAKALSKAKQGDTIKLAVGLYSKASGEQFTDIGLGPHITVPAGVTIEGTRSDEFISTLAGDGNPQSVGLVLAGNATVKNLALQGFGLGVQANKGSQQLSGIFVSQTQNAVQLQGSANATIKGSSIRLRNKDAGLSLADKANATFDGGVITGGEANCNQLGFAVATSGSARVTLKNKAAITNTPGEALILHDSSKITVDGGSQITRENPTGCKPVPAVLILNHARLTAKGNSLLKTTNGRDLIGIDVRSDGAVLLDGAKVSQFGTNIRLNDKVNLSIKHSTISQGTFGIDGRLMTSGAITVTDSEVLVNEFGIIAPSLKLRGTRVVGGSVGVSILGSSADLGTASSPGNNELHSNTLTGVGFDGSGSTSISAVGNTWNANVQGADGSGHYTTRRSVTGGSANSVDKNFALPSPQATIKL